MASQNRSTKGLRHHLALPLALLVLSAFALAGDARAGESYIDQMSGPAGLPDVSLSNETPNGGTAGFNLLSQGIAGGNIAVSYTKGVGNKTGQVQFGSDNESAVRIHNGLFNKVGIVQGGENLSATVGLVNTQGLKVGVFQKPGSDPVNTWILGLKNGGYLVKP